MDLYGRDTNTLITLTMFQLIFDKIIKKPVQLKTLAQKHLLRWHDDAFKA